MDVESGSSASSSSSSGSGGGGGRGGGGDGSDGGADSRKLAWAGVDRLLETSGPFALETFLPGEDTQAFLHSAKVLCVGAGGLGCEILKDLALSGFTDIHVIDMDTIDVTNLNRQFLFRSKDVGEPKCEVAAARINERIDGVQVTAHYGKIQEFETEFYKQFNVIVCGLDNVEARVWLNSKLHSMLEYDEEGQVEPESVVPMIDGGTEVFKGHVRVVVPGFTSCFSCTLELFPKPRTFQLCTMASKPRLPEHCIAWASKLAWPKERSEEKIDCDVSEHVDWLYERALARAEEYGIAGVTRQLTIGVTKNIIPAIASTNAIVSAACVQECWKLCSNFAGTLSSMAVYVGNPGTTALVNELERKEGCAVCTRQEAVTLSVGREETLAEVLARVEGTQEGRFVQASARAGSKTLYMASPEALEKMTRKNLDKALAQLLPSGCTRITVTDESLERPLVVVVAFE